MGFKIEIEKCGQKICGKLVFQNVIYYTINARRLVDLDLQITFEISSR